MNALAQVVIPDPNFRAYLISQYPSVMKPDQTLNPSVAANINAPFQVEGGNFSDITGIQYFLNITSIEIKKCPNLHTIPDIAALTNIVVIGLDSNGLTSLPDLSTLVNLEILSVKYNQLTSIPSLTALTKLEYVLLDHNDLTSVPNVSTLTSLKILSVKHNELTSVPSLAGLTELQHFLVDDNHLTSLPDLTSQVKLYKLSCSDNPLTSLPSFSTLVELYHFLGQRTEISTIPDLNNCGNLEFFICTDNNVTALPPMNNCTLLKELKVFRSKLTSLPDMSVFPDMYSLMVYGNGLSFEDLLPLVSHSQFAGFQLTPQLVGTPVSLGALATAPYIIDLDVDDAVSTNVYKWFKDGVYYTTTSENKLHFTSLQFSDAGIYTCEITNTSAGMAGIVVNTAPITLTVGPCIMANTIGYSFLSNDCVYPVKISVDESSFTGGMKPFTYTTKSGNDSINFSSKDFSFDFEGIYDLIVKDQQGCRVTFPGKLKVARPEICDPVFYPNGDGVADTYYIEDSGTAKIYNRAGEVVRQMNTPTHWDGTNAAGKELPSGLYVIEINNSKSERVTLLR